ncbi:hypothetical protein BDZ91DRAFT_711961 [Kalaharituber pfeilii]|nr:hypothetical protein BDZ91DRAFT_711961 [Kalaharituber pfeilii]
MADGDSDILAALTLYYSSDSDNSVTEKSARRQQKLQQTEVQFQAEKRSWKPFDQQGVVSSRFSLPQKPASNSPGARS